MRKFAAVLLLLFASTALPQNNSSSWVAGPTWEANELTVDLPEREHIRNIGSKVDGAGMCVMSSIEMAARWAGIEELRGLRDWCAREPGGAYPEKVDRQLAKFFKEKNLTPIPYLQYEGRNPEQILSLIDKTGRMACITYGWSPRYGGRISHMVCSPLYQGSGKYAVVLDNNFPGEQKYEWQTKEEMVRRMKLGSGSAWVFVWLVPGPPPVPKNK